MAPINKQKALRLTESMISQLSNMQPHGAGEAQAEASSSSSQPSGSNSKPALVNLPRELQREIVQHVPRKSLKHLQLVSKHWHELASAEIYSDLNFFLTHPDAVAYYNSSAFRPTLALHLFATSSHDYAQYVRTFSISMSDQDSDDVQRRVASKYHFQEESSKLLNTLLLLMVRKTGLLESFIWNVPVELDAEIFDVLSKIPTLHHLTIRYETTTIPRVSFAYHPAPPPLPNSVTNPPLIPPSSSSFFPSHGPPGSSNSPYIIKLPKGRHGTPRSQRQSLSHFTTLRDISILGIDNMEIVNQVATCMKQCSIGLTSFSLTLAPHFARKARRPVTGTSQYALADPLDDEDDDVTQPNSPSAPTPATVPVVNDADIKKEQKRQESILAKIFGLEVGSDAKKVDRSLKAAAAKLRSTENEHERFMMQIKDAVTKMSKMKGGHSGSRSAFFENLDKAVSKYLHHTAENRKGPSAKPLPPKPPPGWGSKPPKFKNLNKSPIPHPNPFPNGLPILPPASSAEQKGGVDDVFENMDFDAFMHDPAPSLTPLPKGSGTPLFQNSSWAQLVGSSSQPGGHPPPPNNGPSSSSFAMPGTLPSTSLYSGGPPPPPNDSFTSHYYPSSSSHTYKPSSGPPFSQQSYWDYPGASSQHVPSSKSPLGTHVYTPPPMEPPPPMPAQNGGGTASQSSNSEDTESDDDDDGTAGSGKGGTVSIASAPEDTKSQTPEEEEMGVDMEHPDVSENVSDDEGDQHAESSGAQSCAEVADEPAAKPAANGIAIPPGAEVNGSTTSDRKENLQQLLVPIKGVEEHGEDPAEALTPEEQMREYIRMKHGFSLESFALYLVPLKPSVLTKALELSALVRLTLLSVGPQGAFWTLMERHHAEFAALRLRRIHTDDVSLAFLACVRRLAGLRELHLVRRSAKDLDCTTTKVPASLHDIRTLALRRHAASLVRLSITNNDDESWDLDARCFRLLAAKATALKELAFSVEITDFHTFIQCLPRMEALSAINIIALRSPDRMSSLGRECRKFLLDVRQHHPRLCLRYVAISGFVHEIGSVRKSSSSSGGSKTSKGRHALALPTASRSAGGVLANGKVDSKGKGKVSATGPPPPAIPPPEEESEEGFSDIETAPQDVIFVKHIKFCEVPGVEVFTRQIRLGKV